MSASLSHEARERLRLFAGSLFKDGERAGLQFPITYADLRALLADADALAAAERERDEARAFGEYAAAAYNELVTHRVTACVYCGHEYEGDTPTHDALTAHISTCSKHPMSALRAQVATLREALECAQYELRLWVQEHGERGPTRFVMGSIADALRATAPEREGADEHAR